MIRATIVVIACVTAGGSFAKAPNPAVCRIAVVEAGGQAYGSGTLVDARDRYGLVVTNWHVVRDASGPVTVIFPSGFESHARVVKLDETWDLAALVIWRPPTEPAPLASTPPRPGERLTICGYGQGDYREATGRCTDYYAPEVGKPMELVELGVQARQGDSGGPILNERGELAGVLFGAGQGVTLGSYGGRVRGFLATLAPDIGLPQPNTLLASATTNAPVATAPAQPTQARPSSTVIDPFQAAERSAAATRVAAARVQRPPADAVASGFPAPTPNLSAAPTVTPQLRNPQHDWRSVPYDAWQVAAKERSVAARPPQPVPLTVAPRPAPPTRPTVAADQETATGPVVDWDADRSTFMAIAGGSAVLVLIGRAFG